MDSARPIPFDSATIEPFATRIIGLAASHFAALKAQEKETGDKSDRFEMESALMHLWWAVKGLDHIAIALRGGRSHDDSSGLHFSMACMNEQTKIARLIKEELGVDVFNDPRWK